VRLQLIPAVVVALELGGGISGLFAVEAVAVFINLVWTSALARRLEGALAPAEPVDPELRRRFWSFAASTSVIVIISFVVWRRSELFILQHYSTDAQIAFYSIAFAAVSGLSKLPETVETVAMPAVANLMGTGQDERIARGFWRAMRLLVLATFPLVAGMAVAGPALLELAYGSDYADAGPVLLVMLAPLLVQPMLRVSEGVLYGLGRPGFIVIAGYGVFDHNPLVHLFFWCGTSGGFGALILYTVASFAVIGGRLLSSGPIVRALVCLSAWPD